MINSERIKLMELRMVPGFDPRKEIERIMKKHPEATQDEIYKLARSDLNFVGSVVIQAITNAMLEIAGNGKTGRAA